MNPRNAALLLAGTALLAVLLVPQGEREVEVFGNVELKKLESLEMPKERVPWGPWARNLVESHVPQNGRIDREVLIEFNHWAQMASEGGGELEEGVRLARQRKKVLTELIKLDAGEAWGKMLAEDEQMEFPAAMREYFEVPVRGVADWMGYAVCFSGLPVSGYREVRFEIDRERVFYGFPVGNLVGAGSSSGIEVRGFVLDNLAILDGEPPRRLKTNEQIPRDAEIDRFDAVSGAEVVSALELERRVVPDHSVADFDGSRVRFFESGENLAAYAASPPEEGGGGPVGAPGESVAGQTDSLPFNGRQNGSAKGGLSLDYRTLLYVRLAYHDDSTQVVQTEGDAYAMLRAVNDHILESSYGRMQILPTVTPAIVLPESESYYAAAGPETLKNDAIAELQKPENGEYVPSDYGHRVFRYDGGPGAGLFGGLAQVGFNPGNIWLKSNSESILTHEVGHNYMLQHANQWNTDDKAAIGPTTDTEYGHKNDVMGNGFEFDKAQFCSFHKQRLGWLKESEYVKILEGGRHRIHALDSATVDPDKNYAVKIAAEGRGNYWVEYRNNYTTNAFKNGVLLQAEGTGWSDIITTMPSRIDATWWSKKELSDTPNPIGMTFSDHEFGIHVTPLERDDDSEWIDVEVHKGAFPGNQRPVALISASTATPNVNQSVTFTVTASDPDGDELALWWYFDDDDLHAHRDPFSLSRMKLWPQAGVRSVVVAVSDMRGGVTWLKSTVTVGSPVDYSVSGRVTDHTGAGIGGAAVDTGLNKNDPNFRVTLTDSDGYYLLGKVIAGSYNMRCIKDFDEFLPLGFSNPITVGASATGIDFQARSLQVTTVGASLAENGGTATFRIERVGGANGEFTDIGVRFLGEAIKDTDYSTTPPMVDDSFTLPAGQPFWDITITGLDDPDTEGPEDIVLALKMTDGLSLIDQQTTQTSLTINDDESALPRVTLTALTRKMNESGDAKGRLTRYGSNALPLTVTFGSSGSAVKDLDWQFVDGDSATFPAGISTTVFAIEGLSDSLLEGIELVEILLNGGSYVADASSDRMLVDLADADIPEISVADVDPVASEPSLNPGHLRFLRTGAVSKPLSVNYGVRGVAFHGTDYQQLAGVFTFPSGKAYTDLVIEPLADSITEGDEPVILRLSANKSEYTVASDAEGEVTILGSKPIVEPTLTFTATTDGNEPTDEPVTFTVTRAGGTSGALTVNYFVEGGTAMAAADYVDPVGSTVIADGSSTGTILIDPNIDAEVEMEETVILSLIPAHGYLVGSPDEATGILFDDDAETFWKKQHFGTDWNNPAVSGDLIDFEGDGVVNLIEFGLFLDPTEIDRHLLPQPAIEGPWFAFTYSRRLGVGLSYRVLASETMAPGTFSPSGINQLLLLNTPTKQTLKARILVNQADKRYMGVEVKRD